MSLSYPTLEEVNRADHRQICKWWRFLNYPGISAIDQPRAQFLLIMEDEVVIMGRIGERLKEFGGFTPEISKSIGWEEKG